MAAQARDAVPPDGGTDAVQAAHAQLLSDQQLQFHFTQMTQPEPPNWLVPFLRVLQSVAPFLQYVFWGGVILIVGIILYALGTEIARRMPRRTPKPDATRVPEKPLYKPSAAHARALLEEADRLAAGGRYGEAVRVLLHRSIEDFERVFALAIGPALTSREIARLEPLSERGRSVFSGIAAAVESSLFGGQAIEAARFKACRDAYAAFAAQEQRR